MKSSATYLNILFFLILSWGLVGAGLYYAYVKESSDFIQNQHTISAHGLKVTAREIESYIDQSRHLLSLLIKDHLPKIQQLSMNPGSMRDFNRLNETVKSHFPESITFTLADGYGIPVVADSGNFIGNGCRLDLKMFSEGEHLNEIFIHSNPDPDAYHIDILQKIPDFEHLSKGIFFVSLDTSILRRLLENGQPYYHRFYLIRKDGDGNSLIELSAEGTPVKFNGNMYLGTEAESSIFSRLTVPGTKWEIVDFLSSEYLQSQKDSMLKNAMIPGVIYLFFSLAFFIILRRSEFKREQQDDEINKLNSLLTRTVRQRTTQLEQSKQLLTYQSTHDGLTGLKNRREFEIRIANAIEDLKHDETNISVVLYIDMDHFKIINETCGMAAGDELIKQVSYTLRGILRRNDFLARIGGDEFGILLANCELVQAELISLTIRQVIDATDFVWDNKTFDITASIGAAEINNSVIDASDLMRQVDAACYAAKEMGRNQVHLYHPDDTLFRNRHNEMYWSGETIRLIKAGRLELFGQKIQAICGADITNWYEVLVRLRDEENNLVFPDKFIPALEQYGGINKLDWEVVNQAIQFLSIYPGVRLNINLSGKSVGDPELLTYIKSLISRYEISPSSLVFEITETVAMTNIGQVRKFIEGIKAQGCQMALDDFGSGMSSFSYLKNLDVDYVKLDGSFVRTLHQEPIHYAMVQSINSVVEVMGKQCIAEFVENKEIVSKLKEIGIAYGQGYHFHKPQKLETISLAHNPASNVVDYNVS